MKTQQYTNHIRYYTPHHFIFYPIVVGMLVISVCAAIRVPGNGWEWAMFGGLWIMLGWLSYMMRQHYALTCQDRIVRLELRFRYYVLTQQRLEAIENRLSFAQLAALRFAADEELPGLISQTLQENLSPDGIKKRISNWLPDNMRV